MNEMVPFEFNNNSVRVVSVNGEPWFVAKDVCSTLGISNPSQAVQQLDDDERAMENIGRQGETNIISESGLYTLLIRSNKPQAKPFRKWVTAEVLPTIRKTGGAYLTAAKAEDLLLNPDLVIGLAKQIKELRATAEQQRLQIEFDQPKVALATAISSSPKSIRIGDFVKVIANEGCVIGRNNFFKWLRFEKILSNQNMPKQKYIDMGWFEVIENYYENKNTNGPQVVFTTLVTGSGQVALLERFQKSEFRQSFLNKAAKANKVVLQAAA